MTTDLHLQFIPFRSLEDRGWRDAWEIYTRSFPTMEQWREAAYARAMADPAFTADGVWLGGRVVAVIFHWSGEGFHYVEHLAVSPAMRGQNLGSILLGQFCRRMGRVVLEIDPPQDEVSIRRQHFYERLGFHANPYRYVHPSFNRPFTPHRLVLMSYPDPMTEDEARRFAEFVRTSVLRYSEHEEEIKSLLE